MDSYSSEAARREWRRILNKVDRGEQVEITRYGEPTAVVVSAAWYRNMRALKRGVLAFTRDSDGHWLDGENELPVGELFAAIGEDVISALDEDPEHGPASERVP